MRRTFLVLATLCLSGCATLSPRQFAASTPPFQPELFFEGPVHSWGVMEDRAGHPKSRFRTEIEGHREGADLTMNQRFQFDDGRSQERVWRVRRLDAHRYEGTATDVIGKAKGEAYGNTFRLQYTLEVKRGNPLTRVRVSQWMYLMADGETMFNRVTISKLGVVVGQTSEYFRRGKAAVQAGAVSGSR